MMHDDDDDDDDDEDEGDDDVDDNSRNWKSVMERKKQEKYTDTTSSRLKLGPNEKMISYDATALFPSVPIAEATNDIKTILENDPTLKTRTKLSPDEITDLISLCLSTSDFLYDGRHHT